MPKDVVKIDGFDGGQNDNADPRDIEPEESAFLQDFLTDRKGRLRNIGHSNLFPASSNLSMNASGTPIPGYGLHA